MHWKLGGLLAVLTVAYTSPCIAQVVRQGTVYSYVVDGVRKYTTKPPSDQRAQQVRAINYTFLESNSAAKSPVASAWGTIPSSILPQCLDPQGLGTQLVGPSARARECTRQYCTQSAYRKSVTGYAMRAQQTADTQQDALTCIMRKEQDSQNK